MKKVTTFWQRDQVELAEDISGEDLRVTDRGEVIEYIPAVNAYTVYVYRTFRRHNIRADQMVLVERPYYACGFREWK